MVQEASKAKEVEFIPNSNVVLNGKPMEFIGKYIIEQDIGISKRHEPWDVKVHWKLADEAQTFVDHGAYQFVREEDND
jgi:hypothetical protein